MRLAATIALLITGTLASAQENSPFDQWDKNHDGKLSRDELPESARRNFDKVDKDSDGWISRQEDTAFRNRNRARSKPALAGITIHEDLSYAAGGHPRQKLDLLLPEKRKADKPLPVIAFIHGGAWRSGDKRSGIGRLAPFVAGGEFAALSIGYRLSGDATWPAQIHDCKAAIRWIRSNAKKYHLDPDRIGVWGSSAGGHLVAMLGVSGDSTELEGSIGAHLDQDSSVGCVVDFFGPSELLTMGDHPSKIDHNAANSPESRLIGGALQEHQEKARHASPIAYVTEGDAAFLIVHGTSDELVPYQQSVDLNRKLVAAGVPSNLITIEGGGHGNFGAAAPEIQTLVRTFLSKHLGGARDIETTDRTLKSD